jgi:hypothetical protein
MAKGNWEANPPPQSDAGNVNSNRGATGNFTSTQPMRKTGKTGSGQMVPNTEVDSVMAPKGRPAR